MARDWWREFHQSLTVGYSRKDSPVRRSSIKMIVVRCFLIQGSPYCCGRGRMCPPLAQHVDVLFLLLYIAKPLSLARVCLYCRPARFSCLFLQAIRQTCLRLAVAKPLALLLRAHRLSTYLLPPVGNVYFPSPARLFITKSAPAASTRAAPTM